MLAQKETFWKSGLPLMVVWYYDIMTLLSFLQPLKENTEATKQL